MATTMLNGVERFAVTTDNLRQLVGLLTGYGRVVELRPESQVGAVIVWEVNPGDFGVSAGDDFSLGRWTVGVEQELHGYDTSVSVVRLEGNTEKLSRSERTRDHVSSAATEVLRRIAEHLDAGNVEAARALARDTVL